MSVYAVIDTNVLISALLSKKSDETFSDPDDLIFYEIALAKQDWSAYLVTGNQRHYPDRNFIVTPAHMIYILESSSD